MTDEQMAKLPTPKYIQGKIAQQWHNKSIKATFEGPRLAFWLWGKPGTGKSRFVRTNFHPYIKKANNKWWDGYSQEKHVLIDEVELNSFRDKWNNLGHNLKIWADPYGFISTEEIKGSTIALNYEVLWVTSNYHPMQLATDDSELLLAIQRRFSIFECFNLNPPD